jgi:Zn-dependent peptidase ImmA (M78 family)
MGSNAHPLIFYMRAGSRFLQRMLMSSESCRARARQVLEELGITDPPVDVEAVAGDLGLTVRYVVRAGAFEGRLIREHMVIEVNKRHHRHKQRFTLSHEIGHFVLSHSPVFSRFDDRGMADPSRVNERQANAFGSELLVPEPAVRAHWTKVRRDEKPIEKMAEAFDVSSEAMYYRLADLDLLGLPPVRTARPEY